jgi:hypothetical protein
MRHYTLAHTSLAFIIEASIYRKEMFIGYLLPDNIIKDMDFFFKLGVYTALKKSRKV